MSELPLCPALIGPRGYERHREVLDEALSELSRLGVELSLESVAQLTAQRTATDGGALGRDVLWNAVGAVRNELADRGVSVSPVDHVIAAFFAVDLVNSFHDLRAAARHGVHQMFMVAGTPGIPATRLPALRAQPSEAAKDMVGRKA